MGKIDENYMVIYELKPKDTYAYINEKNLKKMQDMLETVGVHLSVVDQQLSLHINSKYFKRAISRNAGRRKKHTFKEDEEFYRYSDIVCMLQTMNDKDIANTIGMSIATYYRHKKELKVSDYYKSLDRNRLEDKEYLCNVPGNNIF